MRRTLLYGVLPAVGLVTALFFMQGEPLSLAFVWRGLILVAILAPLTAFHSLQLRKMREMADRAESSGDEI